MTNDVEVGFAGSLTMIVLFTAVTLLLRSFYKRFKKLNENTSENSEESNPSNEGSN